MNNIQILELYNATCTQRLLSLTRSYLFILLDYPPCNASEFQCDNGQCVAWEKRCNGGSPDCYDRSDETGCGKLLTCTHIQ